MSLKVVWNKMLSANDITIKVELGLTNSMLCSKRLPYVLHAVWQQGELFTPSVAKVAQIFINYDKLIIMEFSELIKISRVDKVVVHKPFQEPTIMSLGITGHHLILANDIMKSQQLLVSKIFAIFSNASCKCSTTTLYSRLRYFSPQNIFFCCTYKMFILSEIFKTGWMHLLILLRK